MTLTWGVFYLLSVLTILSGVLTIVMGKNPINSVVYLVSCFVNCALIFILLGVNLLGFIYIIVYVGAIAILFIFVIMMMDLRNLTSEKEMSSNSKGFLSLSYPLALIIAISTLLLMMKENNLSVILQITTDLGSSIGKIVVNDFTTWEIAQRNIWDSLIQSSMNTVLHSVGYLLYTDFLSLLLLASLILLMVMISVIALIKI
uniref:NADH-ubiquinone oxidoreductase chain 6 n=1 Tax=Blastocladiella emersonii TaxID=4808 RepID=B6A7S3_BLAEM|nr:NADH dehydrogenase subunit 6 [Blastocladiella emersonii]ABB78014.1 NADH dehydrogenase subunit 6 [Blastocladiella emersonii]